MSEWDPKQYMKFADHRLRPAVDLLAQVPDPDGRAIWDLGCGTGNVTRLLRERWPEADVAGLDSSAEMLATARSNSGIRWRQGDIADWSADPPADLIYSNATLHWLPDHEALFAHLLAQLRAGGYLAVQMPRNFEAPSHRLFLETLESGPWKATLEPLLAAMPNTAPPQSYYRWLSGQVASLNIWETEYLQVLSAENAVAEWTRGTLLKPFLDALDPAAQAEFFAAYSARVAQAYPPQPDGRTLFPFRRLFLVARR